MGYQGDIYGLGATRVVIAPGATNAVLIQGINYQSASLFKYFSGGSLEIINCPVGSTLTGAQLVTATGGGYLMDAGEKLSVDGAARYYAMATGATTTAMLLYGLSSGG